MIVTRTGSTKCKGSIIEVPSSVASKQISVRFFSYDRRALTIEPAGYQLYTTWIQKGKSSKYYIALIDEYFLVSMSSKFGSTSDIVSIVLDDGTYFNAIIADSRSTSNYYTNTWSSDIIEFVASGSNSTAIEAGLRQSGWLNKNLVKVINYGSWMS